MVREAWDRIGEQYAGAMDRGAYIPDPSFHKANTAISNVYGPYM